MCAWEHAGDTKVTTCGTSNEGPTGMATIEEEMAVAHRLTGTSNPTMPEAKGGRQPGQPRMWWAGIPLPLPMPLRLPSGWWRGRTTPVRGTPRRWQSPETQKILGTRPTAAPHTRDHQRQGHPPPANRQAYSSQAPPEGIY